MRIKKLLDSSLKYMYSRILISDVFKRTVKLEMVEEVLGKYFPKYEVTERNNKYYIYYKKYNKDTKSTYEKRANQKKTYINKILELVTDKKRIKIKELKQLLGLSETGTYRLAKEVLKENSNVYLIKDRIKGDKTTYYCLTTEVNGRGVLDKVPDRSRWRLQALSIDENTFLNIIKNNPGISNGELCKELETEYGSSLKSEVAHMIKVLIKENMIVNIGVNSSKTKLYVQDGSYTSTITFQVPVESIINFIKSHEGCTIREVYDFIKPPYSIANLYAKLKGSHEVYMLLVTNIENGKELWRLFSSKDKAYLTQSEVATESLG